MKSVGNQLGEVRYFPYILLKIEDIIFDIIALFAYVYYVVRTMLEAIISFFPTPGGGAIGALDWSKSERQRLAKLSESYTCPHCCANNEPICKLIKHVDVDGESNAEDREEIEKQIKQLSMAAAPPSPAVSTNPKSENNDIRANSINNNSDVAKDAESAGLKNKEGEGMVVLPTQEILETDDGAPVKTATAAVSIATDSTVGIVVENKNTPAIPVNSTPLKNNATESEKKGTTDLTVKSKSMNQKNVKKEGGDLIDNLFIVAMTLVALLIAYLVGKKMLRSV